MDSTGFMGLKAVMGGIWWLSSHAAHLHDRLERAQHVFSILDGGKADDYDYYYSAPGSGIRFPAEESERHPIIPEIRSCSFSMQACCAKSPLGAVILSPV